MEFTNEYDDHASIDRETQEAEREEKDREWDEEEDTSSLRDSINSLERDLDIIKGYKDMESDEIGESLKDVKKAQQILVEIKDVLFEKEIRKEKIKAEDYTQRFNALAESKEK